MNNNGKSIGTTGKIKFGGLENRLSPFFNALPLDAPVKWMIPFLVAFEDIQYFVYIYNDTVFPPIRTWIMNLYSFFNPEITTSIFYVILNLFLVVSILYLYIILFYYIQSNGRKSLSKRHLHAYSSFYNLVFKYGLSIVFNIFTGNIYLCKQNYIINGIPECSTTENTIFNIVTCGCIFLILFYHYLYNSFCLNTDCLSSALSFGTMHKANTNKIVLGKLFLAIIIKVIPSYFEYKGFNLDKFHIIFTTIIILYFFYIAYSQLKSQPYYSHLVNNYKFAVYFTISIFSLYTLLITLMGINKNQFVSDASFFILLIVFFVGFQINNIYYKKALKRIYKKFHEKGIVSDLRKSTSVDELKYSPEKLKKKNIYKSVERITKEEYIKKEIKVFNNFYECEMACRFIRNNRNIEAYNLMKKLYEEGMSQFKNEADIFLMAWYYMHSMKVFYRENDLLQKFDAELFNGNNILIKAMDLKLDIRKKSLINKAETYIEIEKRENSMKLNTTDIEQSIKLEELKTNVVTTHIYGLQEIKELFTKLRSSTNRKDIASYSGNISKICKLQNSAFSQYNSIIRRFPDARDVIKVYVLFLVDVMNKDELAFKYATGNHSPSIKASSNEVSGKVIDRNNVELLSNSKDKKAMTASSNSLISIPHSEDYSSTSGMGKELRKKINSKNLMVKKFITPIKSLKLRMSICIIIFIVVFCIQALFTICSFNNAEAKGGVLARNINIPGALKTVQFHIRQLSYNLMLNDYRNYGKNIGTIRGTLGYLSDINLVSVSNYMDVPTDSSLIVPVGEYAFDSYETNSLSDSYKKFISYTKFCLNREMLKENETIYNILYEPHFKYFIANSKSNFDLVFSKCKEVLNDEILESFDTLEFVVIGLEFVLIGIVLCIGYITFVPLNKSTKKIMFTSFRMFKYFTKENFEQIITDYEEKIESLCQTFDLDKEITDNRSKNNKTRNYNNIKLIISFVFIIIYILIVGLPVLNVLNTTRNVFSLLQKSSDRLPILKNIQYYTYEVINQDRSIFLEDEPNRILNDLIYKIEKIQDELKTGSYGGPTFDSYSFLDVVTKENGCHRLEMAGGSTCETMVYDSSFGFFEEVGTLPIDELIRTYLYYVKNFISDNEEGKYVHLPFTNKNNIRIMFNQMWSDNFFKFQESIMENILGDIQYIDYLLTEYSMNSLSTNSRIVIITIAIGIFMFLIIDFFVFNKIYGEKIKMDSLVSFVFLVPQPVVNKNEKFKRFLETTQTDE